MKALIVTSWPSSRNQMPSGNFCQMCGCVPRARRIVVLPAPPIATREMGFPSASFEMSADNALLSGVFGLEKSRTCRALSGT